MGFKPISIEKYIKEHFKNTSLIKEKDIRQALKEALAFYKKGERCACGNDIWVIGSAIVGPKCFNCMQVEGDPKEHYEIKGAIIKRKRKQINNIKSNKTKKSPKIKTDLDLVIHELRKEKKNLERLIKDCVKGRDFLGAHAYKEALQSVQQQLSPLVQIKNPNIEKIRRKVNTVNIYKKRLYGKQEKFKNHIYSKFLKNQLIEAEKELKELRSQKIDYGLDDLLLPDLLNELVEKKIKRIKLELLKYENVVLGLRLTKTDLIIELSGMQKNSKYHYANHQVIQLNKMGFVFNGIKLERVLKDFKTSAILNIIEILARIIYDVFDIKELEHPMNLIIET